MIVQNCWGIFKKEEKLADPGPKKANKKRRCLKLGSAATKHRKNVSIR